MEKKTNYKGKRRFSKNKGNANSKRAIADEVKEEKYNDPSWYVANGQLLKDFASLSFNNALGARSRISFNTYDATYLANTMTYTAPVLWQFIRRQPLESVRTHPVH